MDRSYSIVMRKLSRRFLWVAATLLAFAGCSAKPQAPAEEAQEEFAPARSPRTQSHYQSNYPEYDPNTQERGAHRSQASALSPLAIAKPAFEEEQEGNGDEKFAESLSHEALASQKAPPSAHGSPIERESPSNPQGGKAYAVIIDGDSSRKSGEDHQDNVEMATELMRSYYHVDDHNMAVFSPYRGHPATIENITTAAQKLANLKLNKNDSLIIYTTGHGGRSDDGRTWLHIKDGNVPDQAFADAFLSNGAGKTVYIGDQCYSGGFAKAMASTSKHAIAISATDAYTSSYCKEFIVPFFKTILNAIRNGNENITEKQAFDAAKVEGYSEYITSPKNGYEMAMARN